MGLLSWCPIFNSSHCNTFEDWVPVDFSSTVPQASIDPSHKSQNASVPHPTMQHFVTECAHFCYKMLHCGIFAWCIVGFVRWVNWVTETWLYGRLVVVVMAMAARWLALIWYSRYFEIMLRCRFVELSSQHYALHFLSEYPKFAGRLISSVTMFCVAVQVNMVTRGPVTNMG